MASPDGFHHNEQCYGFMNDGGAASIWMPMWYRGRFTDHRTDPKGTMAIRLMPVFDGFPSVYGVKSKFTAAVLGAQSVEISLLLMNRHPTETFTLDLRATGLENLRFIEQLALGCAGGNEELADCRLSARP